MLVTIKFKFLFGKKGILSKKIEWAISKKVRGLPYSE